MPRKGRLLEVLVQSLERLLAPHNVAVESPKTIYDEIDGKRKKTGEIDVVVSGDFGSARMSVGFECRDRSSKQGTDWITQVFGKKQLFNLDAITAVSDTMFTREAEEAAKS